ncbi:hypothetical protein Zmor_017235 [Zophobas morio]|uniref:Gustatory receptor n=1 Tax=Zophobas morio TaxID=2755281 RepID=A0AA38I8F8_9CUCU|nr:hypothetical protein Zmor_017235 [Zophobas morio]
MFNMLSVKDINFIYPLCVYLRIFLITPWYDFIKNRDSGLQISRLYGVAFIALRVYFTVCSATDDIMINNVSQFLITQKIVYFGTYAAFFSINVLNFFKSSFCDIENWKILFRKLHTVDNKLENIGDQEKSAWKNFYVGFAAKQAIFVGVVAYEVYIWSLVIKLSVVKILFISGFAEMFNEYLLILLMRCLVQVLQSRYEDLNNRLLNMKEVEVSRVLKNLVHSYRLLNECVYTFSNLFGYQIILIIFHFYIEIIHGLNFTFVSFVIPVEKVYYKHLLISGTIVLVLMTYNLLTIVLPIHATTQEAKRFVSLLYKLQEEFPEGSTEAKSLVKWTNISQQYVPDFSAAGFFSINKTLVFTVAGTVATYFIITIQLNESEYARMDKV